MKGPKYEYSVIDDSAISTNVRKIRLALVVKWRVCIAVSIEAIIKNPMENDINMFGCKLERFSLLAKLGLIMLSNKLLPIHIIIEKKKFY